MARRWTEYEPRAGTVLTDDSVNRPYDAYKGQVNGGIDRTMLQEEAVSRDMLSSYAFLAVTVLLNSELSTDYQQSVGGTGAFKCLEYNEYPGGWVDNTSIILSNLKEGMLHVEFSCWAYHNIFNAGLNPRFAEWRLLWNGVPVAQTAEVYGAWNDLFLVADFPISTATGTLSLEWRYTAPNNNVVNTLPWTDSEFMFGGGSLYIQGVWR